MSHRKKKKNRSNNRFGMLMTLLVVAMLSLTTAVKARGLRDKVDNYEKREAELTAQIEAEERRSETIAEYEKYTKTRKYIEEIAREKLGLVYEDEIIFKRE